MFEKKERYNLEDFLQVMRILRSPQGCLWDMEQTHKSIRRDFLEECYEAIEAIDTDDSELLREELGDVLLQLVFHSAIEEENSNFDFYDVINDITHKMIIRHPHVFGNICVENVDELLTNWDNIKKDTKGQKSDKEMLMSISKAMPALMRGQKVIKKSKKLGVSMDEKMNIIDLDTIDENSAGKMLLTLVNACQAKGIDAEEVLSKEVDLFIEEKF